MIRVAVGSVVHVFVDSVVWRSVVASVGKMLYLSPSLFFKFLCIALCTTGRELQLAHPCALSDLRDAGNSRYVFPLRHR